MNVRRNLLHKLYLVHQDMHSAWIRQRYAADINRVRRFCLFVGYPRSGHSLLGAMLNAHPDAVISHELIATDLVEQGCTREALYSRILARAFWFNLRGNRANYSYRIPNSWQGRYRNLFVIGDKRGGSVSRHLNTHPDFLPRLRSLLGISLRLIHTVRNPFDNISAISISDKRPLNESIEYYFLHCETTAKLENYLSEDERITTHHEQMFENPALVISSLCHFLDLEPDPAYLEACCKAVFPAPTYTRRKVPWHREQVREVESRIRDIPFLSEYAFDDDR